MKRREAVERPAFASVGRGFAREGVSVGHEQILDRVIVAAGAFEADDAPDVVDARARFRDQHGSFGRLAVGSEARRAVGLQHGTVTAEPAGMLDAAGEAPIA
jgi:hypothetical protein